MPELKPVAIEIFSQYASAVDKTRKELIGQAWFGADWWINQRFGATGFLLQLSKTGWFNHGGRGIHFEFWLGEREYREKSLPIVLHFEPETPDRAAMGASFMTAFAPLEDQFGDYRINHKAICDKLQKQEKLSKTRLPELIVYEFSRLKEIAPVIDAIIS